MKAITDKSVNGWYAARIVKIGAYLMDRLTVGGIKYYYTKYAPNILFIKCTGQYVDELKDLYRGRIFFYRNAERTDAQAISDKEMDNFILVTSASGEILNLGTVTSDFLEGERVRVISGPFKGAEGVIRRIKGDRRLVISIDGVTAVATCYIRPEFLEKVV